MRALGPGSPRCGVRDDRLAFVAAPHPNPLPACGERESGGVIHQVYGMCAAVMVLPWLVKNWIVVGNPLSPFANKLFPNPGVTISLEQEYIEQMRHYENPKRYWDIPVDLTLHGAMLSVMYGLLS